MEKQVLKVISNHIEKILNNTVLSNVIKNEYKYDFYIECVKLSMEQLETINIFLELIKNNTKFRYRIYLQGYTINLCINCQDYNGENILNIINSLTGIKRYSL